MPVPKKESVTKVCIDDFAFRKRKTYGTVMVDIETHKVIGLLASREVEDVAEWLRSYPNLEVVSRDGSVSYKSAIEQAGEHIQQVMKRFVKCFFELLTQNFSERRETDRKKGRTTRLWTFRSRFRGRVV